MAKFELKFIDFLSNDDFIQVKISDNSHFNSDLIEISGEEDGQPFRIILDKSTAIRFAKTLRTEINKIQESEVGDGRR